MRSGQLLEVRRSRRVTGPVGVHAVALWWLILPDQAIPHHLTVALFWFRPLVWSRVGAPSALGSSCLYSTEFL